MRTLARYFFNVLLILPMATLANPSNVKVFDNYEVHYSIFNTSFLSPDIAESYQLVRSGSKALINIAVLEKNQDGVLQNVDATISGDQFDLIRKEQLTFKEVREQQAIYYLSTIDIQHRTLIYFTFKIKPSTSKSEYTLEFSKELFKDE